MSKLFASKSTHRVVIKELVSRSTKTITIHDLDLNLDELRYLIEQAIIEKKPKAVK